MQRAPSTESNSVLKGSPSLMAAVLPLLTPTERRALQFTERSAFESFPPASSSSSSGVTSIRDLAPRASENAIHDPNWQVYSNLPYSTARSGNHNALAKATKDLIALQPPPSTSSDYHAHRDSSDIGNVQTLSPISVNGGTKASGRSMRSNSSGSVGTMLGAGAINGVGGHHHRPIAPAPPAGVSKSTRASTNRSPPSAKRPRRSLSPPPQLAVGISNNSASYGSPPTLSVTGGPSSASLLSGSPLASPPGGSAKATLLTPQQKKANHIQSEQKRRANIRRGYEALCETIPALREAIRAEEEMGNGQSNISVGGISKKRRSREDSGEKVDGRAGPRSESVVLQKTIEHIQGLLYEKAALLSRLERACATLGPSHPALKSADSFSRLWEREWDGGKGLMVVNGEVLHGSDEE